MKWNTYHMSSLRCYEFENKFIMVLFEGDNVPAIDEPLENVAKRIDKTRDKIQILDIINN